MGSGEWRLCRLGAPAGWLGESCSGLQQSKGGSGLGECGEWNEDEDEDEWEDGGLGLFGVGLGVELAGGAVGPGGAGFDPLAEGTDFHVGEGDLEAGHHALVEALAGDGFEEEGLVGFAGDDVGAAGGAGKEGGGVVGEV